MAESNEYAFKSPRGFSSGKKKPKSRFVDGDGFSEKRNLCRTRIHRDTGFCVDEIKQRSNLFQCEFDQEELHDRILVVQVMPDDYEMQELQARLDVSEVEDEAKWEVCARSSDVAERSEHVAEADSRRVRYGEVHPRHEINGSNVDAGSVVTFSGGFLQRVRKWEETETSEAVHDVAIPERREYVAEANSRRRVCYGEMQNSHVLNVSNFEEKPVETFSVVSALRVGKQEECETSETVHDEVAIERESESGSNDDVVVETSSDTETKVSSTVEVDSGCFHIERIPSPIDSTCLKELHVNEREVVSDDSETCEDSKIFDHASDESLQGSYESVGENETGSVDACGVHVLRERRVYVHACWLAVNSRYFRSLLYESGMKECSSKEFSMKVTESEETAFMTLMESIYNPDILNAVDVTILLNVLRLSVKYDVMFSTKKAKRVLQATPLTLEVCEAIIEVVVKGGLSDLDDVMENVERLLFQEFAPLDETWESEKFASLSEGALRVLLGSDRLVVQSENTVFIALMRWIAKHVEVYGDMPEYSDLLNLVRFDLIKPSYLHDVVQVHEVATRLDNFDAIYLAAITDHALPEKRRRRPAGPRHWCEAKTPTFMWILDSDPEMFVFGAGSPTNSPTSSSFWYFGYKMHLRLDLSAREGATQLALVVENLSADGSVQLAYDVDVKFSDGLHRSYTSEPFIYRGKQPPRGKYPFDPKYSLDEIKEILFGGSVRVTIIFEISVEKLLDD